MNIQDFCTTLEYGILYKGFNFPFPSFDWDIFTLFPRTYTCRSCLGSRLYICPAYSQVAGARYVRGVGTRPELMTECADCRQLSVWLSYSQTPSTPIHLTNTLRSMSGSRSLRAHRGLQSALLALRHLFCSIESGMDTYTGCFIVTLSPRNDVYTV